MRRPCKACGAPLIFATGPKGKPIPLDARPQMQVYVVVEHAKAGLACAPVQGYYVTHFATCPQASKFKRPPARKPGETEHGRGDAAEPAGDDPGPD